MRAEKDGRVDLKTVIIEDNAGYRESLRSLLTHAAGFRLVGAYDSPLPALKELGRRVGPADEAAWDLVLMDIDMPDMSGIEATRLVKKLVPRAAIVMLTVFEEPATILEAICAGADGYLLKKSPAPELLSQLRAIAAGGAPMTMGVARTVLDLLRSVGPVRQGGGPAAPGGGLDLTGRERDVLQCLVRGLSYKQSADALGISLDTVRTHIQSVYRKLQVHSVAEAVSRAVRERLV